MNAMAAMIPIKIQTAKTTVADKGSSSYTADATRPDQSFAGILSVSRGASVAAKNSSAKGKANSDDSTDQTDSSGKDKAAAMNEKDPGSDTLLGASLIEVPLAVLAQSVAVGASEQNDVTKVAAVNQPAQSPIGGMMEKGQSKNATPFEANNAIIGQQSIATDDAVTLDSTVNQNLQQSNASVDSKLSAMDVLQRSNLSGGNKLPADALQQLNASDKSKVPVMDELKQSNVSGDNDSELPFQLNVVKQGSSILSKPDLQQSAVAQMYPTGKIAENENLVVQAVAATGEEKKIGDGQKQAAVAQSGSQATENTLSSVSVVAGSNDDLKKTIPNFASTVVMKNSINASDAAYQDGGQLTGEKKQLPGQNTDSVSDSNSVSTNAFPGLLDQQNVSGKTSALSSNPNQPSPHVVHDPYDITSQIVQQAHLLKNDQNSEMIIQLKPEHLGELTLKVAVENGTVSTTFHSSNAEVRNILESSIPQLKQEMSNQGIKVDYVGVSAQLGQSLSDGSRENLQQQWVMRNQNKRQPASEEFIQAVEVAGSPQSVATASGVDYRI